MAKLKVRINPVHKGCQSHFRAGMTFTPAWQEIEVDDATASALQAEQLLEVHELQVIVEPPAVDSTVSHEIVEGQDGSTGSPRADENLLPTSEEPPPAADEILPPATEKTIKKGKV